MSFANVTLLSVDRFLALHLHMRYKELITVKRIVLLLAVVWVTGAIVDAIWKWLPKDLIGVITV